MRVKRGVTRHRRHRKILERASGFRGSSGKLIRRARLAVEKGQLKAERANLVEAVAKGNGEASPALMRRIAELDEQIADATQRLDDAHGELAALELGELDAEELRAALEDLEPTWAELFPKERTRVLALLLERIEFDATKGEVALTFRTGGPTALHRRNGESR